VSFVDEHAMPSHELTSPCETCELRRETDELRRRLAAAERVVVTLTAERDALERIAAEMTATAGKRLTRCEALEKVVELVRDTYERRPYITYPPKAAEHHLEVRRALGALSDGKASND